MPISINWPTSVIHVPKLYLTPVSGTLYELDTEQFREDLKALEDNEQGISYLKTHNHFTEYTVAGVTYARAIIIVAPYTVEFENGAYSVRLVGSNNNIFDVEAGILVQNTVQVIPGNAAGLIIKSVGSGLSVGEQAKLDELWKLQGLDISNPMTVTPTNRDAGSVGQVISGDGETTTTVTRSP